MMILAAWSEYSAQGGQLEKVVPCHTMSFMSGVVFCKSFSVLGQTTTGRSPSNSHVFVQRRFHKLGYF